MMESPVNRKGFIRMDFLGVEETAKALRDIGKDKTIKAAQRRELRKAATPTLEMARRNAPTETQRMRDGISLSGILSRKQRRGGRYAKDPTQNTVHLFLGAKPRGPAVLTEFGTGPRYTKKGKFTGSAPAQPFLRPAWEADKMNILDRYQRGISKSILRAARRANKKRAAGK